MKSKRRKGVRVKGPLAAPRQPAYRKAVVTFLDILGFRDLVATNSADVISQKLKALGYYAVREPGIWKDNPFQKTTVQFSDSVIRVRPVELGEFSHSGILFHELLDLAQTQAELARQGILVRGGVAFGDVCVEGASVFGPAFIEAYEIESKLAINARIVIAPGLMRRAREDESLKLDQHNFEDEWGYLKQVVARGEDGLWFVDYIRAVSTEFDETEGYIAFLAAHRDLITTAAKRLKRFDGVASKYVWLASYHNRWIRSCNKEVLLGFGIKRRHLLVAEDAVPGFVERGPAPRRDKPRRRSPR